MKDNISDNFPILSPYIAFFLLNASYISIYYVQLHIMPFDIHFFQTTICKSVHAFKKCQLRYVLMSIKTFKQLFIWRTYELLGPRLTNFLRSKE